MAPTPPPDDLAGASDPGVTSPGPGAGAPDQPRLAALEHEVARLTGENARLAGVIARRAGESAAADRDARRAQAEAERELERLRRALEHEQRTVAAVRGQPAVRLILAARRLARRAVAAGRSKAAGPGPGHRTTDADARTRVAAVARRVERAPEAGLAAGPPATIVVVATPGCRLDDLLRALARTRYRQVEVVVAAPPGVEVPAESRIPVRWVALAADVDPAAARAAAIVGAAGEILVLLDAGAVPARPDWLGCLVQAILERELAVVGPRIIVPAPAGGRVGPPVSPLPGTVVAGLDLVLAGGYPIGTPAPADAGAAGSPARGEKPSAALSGVCLAVRRTTWDAVGPLAGVAPFDQEDVDFCLRVAAAGGRIGVDERAVVWHPLAARGDRDASASGRAAAGEGAGVRGAGAVALASTWGPRLFRSVMGDRLAGDAASPPGPVRAVVVGVPGDPAAAALEGTLAALGWAVARRSAADEGSVEGPGVDVLVTLDPTLDLRPRPRSAIRVAWVTDAQAWSGTAWLDEHDLLLVPDAATAALVAAGSAKAPVVVPVARDGAPSAAQVRDALRAWVEAPRAAICAPPPDWARATQWGDYPFARDLQRALERRGMPSTVYFRSEWGLPVEGREDVAIQIIGLGDPLPRASQVNVAWIISHPERVSDELVRRYDAVFVASDGFAAKLRSRTGVDAVPLHQATDPERFFPDASGPVHDLLYVANARATRRSTIGALAPTRHDLAVYGRGWTEDFLDPSYLKAEHIPNGELRRYYGSARIVLNDHWDEMAAEGFITNRLYDAMASGAFVVSDPVAGLDAEFDGAVATWADAVELRLVVDRYLGDPDARAARAAAGRQAVLARHTFGQRADAILERVRPLLAARAATLEGPTPEGSR